jgi:hypothetical protein
MGGVAGGRFGRIAEPRGEGEGEGQRPGGMEGEGEELPGGAGGFADEGQRESERAGGDVCRGEFGPSMAVCRQHSAGGVPEAEGKTEMDGDHPGIERAAGAPAQGAVGEDGRGEEVRSDFGGKGAEVHCLQGRLHRGAVRVFEEVAIDSLILLLPQGPGIPQVRSIGVNRVNGGEQ